jgi:hypothetical protein
MQLNITNVSSKKQQRWATVALPVGQGPQGTLASFGQGYLAVKGPTVGRHSQLWDVFCAVRGRSTLKLDGWQDLPVAGDVLPVPKFSDWIQAGKLIPSITVTRTGGQAVTFRIDQWAIEFATAARIRFVGAGMGGGFNARVWADVWVWQDAIDLRGFIGWSDQADPTERINCSISFALDEPVAMYLAGPSGFVQHGNSWQLLTNQDLVDGNGIGFRGVVVPTDKTPATVEEERTGYEDAAMEGPLVATCSALPGEEVWDGHWLANGKVTPMFRNQEQAWAFLDRWSGAQGNVLDPRPLANAGETGRTGDQPCFGATKDLLAINGDSLRLYEMMWSADDYLMRGLMRFEPYGGMTTFAKHQDWMTWSGSTAKNAQDKLGKTITAESRPYGWERFGPNLNRLSGVDDQHRGDLYIDATLALTGDPVLREQKKNHLQTDRARAMRRNRWLDAPRAAGRLMLSWANSLLLLPPDQEALIVDLALDELSMWEPLVHDDRPVQWLATVVADTVLPWKVAAMPWMEAQMVLGTLAMERALRRIGRVSEADRFLDFTKRVSTTCLLYATLVGQDGIVRVCNGVEVRGGSAAQPPEYYTFPRAGAVMQPTAGSDLLVGDPGWCLWWGSVIAVGLDYLDGLAKQRALALDQQNRAGQLDLHAAEWITA